MIRGGTAYPQPFQRGAVFARRWSAFAIAWVAGLAACGFGSGPCGLLPTAAFAQDAAPAPAPKRKAARAGPTAGAENRDQNADQAAPAKDPAEAARSYTEGVKAYQAGKLDLAVQFMTTSMQGGLANTLVPKALYYRGAAYSKQHQPGLAISDLSSALYFKGGLDDAERTEALKLRSAAYSEAGLPEQPDPGTTANAVETGGVAANGTVQSDVPKAAGLGAGLGSIFGDLFGSKPAAAPPAAPPAPAPIAAPQPQSQAPAAALAANSGEVLPWAQARTLGSTSQQVAPAAGPEPAGAAAPPSQPHAAKGKFRIQVASVTSRDEASLVISSLQSKGEPLSNAPVSVDQQKFGEKTYYRVRLGPYPTVADTKAPCDALKAAGLDCLVSAK